MSKHSAHTFARLRAQVRAIVLTEGCAVAPGSPTPDAIDDLIGTIADHHTPTLEGDGQALLALVSDRALAIEISNHFATIMAAYGDGGYFVGVCAGLELAALTFCGAVAGSAKKGGRR